MTRMDKWINGWRLTFLAVLTELKNVCLDDSPALGEIHTFRLAVWAAHLGGHQAEYENPVTEESLAR